MSRALVLQSQCPTPCGPESLALQYFAETATNANDTYQYRYSGNTNAYPKNILDNMVGRPAARPAVQAWGRRLMEVAIQRPPHTAQPTGQANTGTGIGIMLVLALGYFRRPAHNYGHMSLQFNPAVQHLATRTAIQSWGHPCLQTAGEPSTHRPTHQGQKH